MLLLPEKIPSAAFSAQIEGAQCRPPYKGESGLPSLQECRRQELATLIKLDGVDAQSCALCEVRQS